MRGMPKGRLAMWAVLIMEIASANVAFAFDPRAIAWRTLGKDQGFAGGAVSCVMQDRQGLMWIGAAGGLYRYDGHGFKAFRPDSDASALSSSSISAVLEDRRGNIWVGSDGGGLARYDAAAGSFAKIRLGEADEAGESGARISALAVDASGRILAGTVGGEIWRIEPSGLNRDRLAASGFGGRAINALMVDSKGGIWAGTDGGGLGRFDSEGTSFVRYRHDGAIATSIAADSVGAIIEDSLGFIWVGFSNGSIDLIEGTIFRHAKIEAPSSIAGERRIRRITAMAEDIRGQIWAGFRDGGLGILDPSSMEMLVTPFMEGAEVRALARDRRGLMWAGLQTGGLLTGDPRSMAFSRFSISDEGQTLGSIQTIVESPSGALLAASRSAGLLSFDPLSDSLKSVKLPAGIKGLDKKSPFIARRDGSLLIGTTDYGLFRKKADGSIQHFAHDENDRGSLASSSISCLLEKDEGSIWVGTEGGGLDLLDLETGRAIHWGGKGDESLLAASIIACIAADSKGRIWVGSADAGLFVLDPGGSRFRPIGLSDHRGGGIGDLRIECVFEDSRGVLWVGTGGAGLVGLKPETGIVTRRGIAVGLFADAIYGLAEDKAGTLWVASSAGLFSFDPIRNDVFLFGEEDGLQKGGLEAGALLVSGKGEVWVGSGQGLTRFDPARITRYAPAPDVVISEVESLGEGRSAFFSRDGSEIALEYDNRGLGFSIAAIDFAAPERNRYEMRLEGRQSAWTAMGNVNTGYIAPLAPGRYILRARASNGNGIWNYYGASLSILVRSPWWATWWFRGLVLSVAAAIIAGAIAARVGSLRRRNALLVKFARHIEEAREEERTIAARDVHDEIGQHLMVLNFHAYWLAAHPESKTEERQPVVRDMQKAILDAMASVKAVATRLRPFGLETLDFPDALRWYLGSFGRMSGIKTSLDIGEGWKELSPDQAKAFFRLLQEMLSNVARHSAAKSVAVSFSANSSGFILETKDDGVGIEPGKVDAQDSFGIIGMRERCAAFDGSLTISGAPGQGCAVIALLPKNGQGEPKTRSKHDAEHTNR